MILKDLLTALNTYNTITIQEEIDGLYSSELEVIKNGNKLKNENLVNKEVKSVFVSPSGSVFITLQLV